MKVTIDGIEYAPVLVFHNTDTRSLSQLLKDIRAVLNWTIVEACSRSGCASATLWRAEQGLSSLSLLTAARISRAYGVPIHILAAAALNEES